MRLLFSGVRQALNRLATRTNPASGGLGKPSPAKQGFVRVGRAFRPWHAGAAVLALAAGLASPAQAVDHNNVDAHRPLDFDDAESIAFREQSLEFGLDLLWPRRSSLGLEAHAEYLYGFALNSHLTLGFEASIGGRATGGDPGDESVGLFHVGGSAGGDDTRFASGVSLGLFHNFNREYGGTPALSLRGDVFLPTGRDSDSVEFRVRGIASKHVSQHGRLHVNADLNVAPGAGRGERELNPALILGYTQPLGYPRKFNRTGLAQLGIQAGPESGKGPVITAGLGIRQQIGVRSVLDVGVLSDVAGFNGAPRDRLRLVAGYSYGF